MNKGINMTEEEYEDLLNENYGEVMIAGHAFEVGTSLRILDYIAFREGYLDYIDAIERDE